MARGRRAAARLMRRRPVPRRAARTRVARRGGPAGRVPRSAAARRERGRHVRPRRPRRARADRVHAGDRVDVSGRSRTGTRRACPPTARRSTSSATTSSSTGTSTGMAWHVPGLVVLHDLALDDFVRGLPRRAIRSASRARCGRRSRLGRARPSDATRARTSRSGSPGAPRSRRRSRGIVVHSPFCRRYLEALGCRTPVFVVPHPPPETARAIARGRGARVARCAPSVGARGADARCRPRRHERGEAAGRARPGGREPRPPASISCSSVGGSRPTT